MASVSLNCAPLNMEGADTFTYNWTGPSGQPRPDTESTLVVFEQGSYTCVVSNAIGSNSTEFQVTGNQISFMLIVYFPN